MKTPKEIKKGLDALKMCHDLITFNPLTGEDLDPLFLNDENRDLYYGIEAVLTYIQQLEAGLDQWEGVASSPGAVEDMARENYRLTQELESVKRERDALHYDLSTRDDACDVCKHGCLYKNDCEELFGDDGCSFEWQGVCKENTEAD